MKQLFKNLPIILILLTYFTVVKPVRSQVNCDVSIVYNTDTLDVPFYDTLTQPLCIGADFELFVSQCEHCTYLWNEKDDTEKLSKIYKLITNIDTTETFKITVIDTLNSDTCVNEVTLTTYPRIYITFKQVQLTCTNGDNDNGNTAQVKATANGAFSPSQYHYFWNVHPLQIAPNDSSLAIGLKAHLNYTIEVKDNYGCMQADTFYTKAYDNAEIEIFADPDTAYIERPHVEFSFENKSADSITITNHFWDFADDTPTSDLDEPVHTFTEEGDYFVVLTAYNQQGCDTTYVHPVSIQPIKLFIPNVFTPNEGDDINNYFVIRADKGTSGGDKPDNGGAFKSIEATNPNAKPLNFYYESTNLIIINRWGNKVYESNNYNNDWDGGNLSDGTYFYILKCHGFKNDYTFKGSVAIFRGGNN